MNGFTVHFSFFSCDLSIQFYSDITVTTSGRDANITFLPFDRCRRGCCFTRLNEPIKNGEDKEIKTSFYNTVFKGVHRGVQACCCRVTGPGLPPTTAMHACALFKSGCDCEVVLVYDLWSGIIDIT